MAHSDGPLGSSPPTATKLPSRQALSTMARSCSVTRKACVPPAARSRPPRSSKAAVTGALEDAHPAGAERLEEPLREAPRQLGGVGRGGDRGHRVQQQPHVAVVLRLVAGEDPLQPVEAAGVLHVRALLPDADAAGAAAPGRAQRLVRAPDQLVRVDRLLQVDRGDARAELQPQDALVVSLLAQPPHDVLRHDPAVVDRRVEEDDGEDRAAVAGHVIVAAEPRPDLGRDLPQHAVAGAPVEPLVDPAEVVRPEQEEHGRPFRLRGAGQGRLQLGLELRPIRQPRDVVEERPGQGARVGGEGGGHPQEALPPPLVVEGVGRRVGNPQ